MRAFWYLLYSFEKNVNHLLLAAKLVTSFSVVKILLLLCGSEAWQKVLFNIIFPACWQFLLLVDNKGSFLSYKYTTFYFALLCFLISFWKQRSSPKGSKNRGNHQAIYRLAIVLTFCYKQVIWASTMDIVRQRRQGY